jgi:uncharacterized membrane protein
MEQYLLFRILHAVLGIILLLSILVHGYILWRAWRQGDVLALQRKLQRTRTISLPLLALLTLILPITGWRMINMVGWPLGQSWLLLGVSLFAILMIVGLLLAGRLRYWQILSVGPVPVKLLRFVVVYAALLVLLLLGIMLTMSIKPVW